VQDSGKALRLLGPDLRIAEMRRQDLLSFGVGLGKGGVGASAEHLLRGGGWRKAKQIGPGCVWQGQIMDAVLF